MAIGLNDNIRVGAGKPSEAKYLNLANAPYTGTSQVFSQIPIGERHPGLTVLLAGSPKNVEYWFNTGLTNSALQIKASSGGTSNITANNGLTKVGNNILLGGFVANDNVTISGDTGNYKIEFGNSDQGVSGIDVHADQILIGSPEFFIGNISQTRLISIDDPNNQIKISDGALEFNTDSALNKFNFNGGAIVSDQSTFQNNELVTRSFATSLDEGRQYKTSVKIATIGLISTTTISTLYDGITLLVNDRILVWNQNTLSENGLYRVNSIVGPVANIVRASDFSTNTVGGVNDGVFVLVNKGTHSGSTFIFTTSATTVTVGVTPIVFKKIGSNTFATNGITKVGNTFRLGGTLTAVTTTISGTSSNLNINVSGVTFGTRLSTAGNKSFVAGTGNRASGSDSAAFGNSSSATGSTSFATNGSSAFGSSSHSQNVATVAKGQGSSSSGFNTLAEGDFSTTEGRNTHAQGADSHAGGRSTSAGRRVIAGGLGSFNHSTNDTNQISGHGSLAAASAILGGFNHNLPSGNTRSVIIGGNTIKAASGVTDTVFLPKVRLGLGSGSTLTVNNANNNVLVRNSVTGEIELRTNLSGGTSGSTINAGSGLSKTGNTIYLGGYVNKGTTLITPILESVSGDQTNLLIGSDESASSGFTNVRIFTGHDVGAIPISANLQVGNGNVVIGTNPNPDGIRGALITIGEGLMSTSTDTTLTGNTIIEQKPNFIILKDTNLDNTLYSQLKVSRATGFNLNIQQADGTSEFNISPNEIFLSSILTGFGENYLIGDQLNGLILNSNIGVKLDVISSTGNTSIILKSSDTSRVEVISANVGFKGITYDSDYSSNFGPRSIPDVAWVTGYTSGSTGGNTTASNGLTKVGNDIQLGGNTSANVSINTNANSFTVYSNNGGFELLNSNTTTMFGTYGSVVVEDNLKGLTLSGRDSLSAIKTVLNLGSTGATFIDNTSGNTGIQYASDYSTGFTSLSLVHKGWVEAQLSGSNTVELTSAPLTLNNQTRTLLVDTTTSSVTITVPVSPYDGQKITIKDTGNATTNNVTIDGNGKTIDGSLTSVINTNFGAIEILYSLTLDSWFITSFVS